MAKVTIIIEDTIKDGQAACAINFNVDHQGADRNAPPTDSLVVATAFQRMWAHGAFAKMAALVCDDILALVHQRQQAAARQMAPVSAAASAPAAAPDRQGAEDVKPVEAVVAPGTSSEEVTKAPAKV